MPVEYSLGSGTPYPVTPDWEPTLGEEEVLVSRVSCLELNMASEAGVSEEEADRRGKWTSCVRVCGDMVRILKMVRVVRSAKAAKKRAEGTLLDVGMNALDENILNDER